MLSPTRKGNRVPETLKVAETPLAGGHIVNSWREFDEAPGDIELLVAGATGQVARLLRISGVTAHIPVADSVEAARATLVSRPA